MIHVTLQKFPVASMKKKNSHPTPYLLSFLYRIVCRVHGVV